MSEQGTSVHPWPNGADMLNAHDLANACGVQIEAQAKRIEELEAELVSAQNAKDEADEYITRQARITDDDFSACDLERRHALREVAEAEAELAEVRAAHEATKAAARTWGTEAADTYNAVVRERDGRIAELVAAAEDHPYGARLVENMRQALIAERAAHEATKAELEAANAFIAEAHALYGETLDRLKAMKAELEADRADAKKWHEQYNQAVKAIYLAQAELARVTEDAIATKARLRLAESALAAKLEARE
jgi:hypothetical protein